MLVLALVAATLVAAAGAVEYKHMDSEYIVDNEWIVVLDAERVSADAHLDATASLKGKMVAGCGGLFRYVFVNGVSRAELDARMSGVASELVQHVEPNQRVFTNECSSEEAQSWGLGRVSGPADDASDNGFFSFDTTGGEGVAAYIIDTGIRITHEDFGGRARWGANTIDNSDSDGNGHGTHVASTVGGTRFGIAKASELVAVKVLNSGGGGTVQSVVGGIDYTCDDAAKRYKKKAGALATANMSLGGGKSSALDNAASASVKSGIVMVVAAGNSNNNACTLSPAGADDVITVGATDLGNAGGSKQIDERSYFSSWGSCLEIFAPGSDIKGAWIRSDNDVNTISGTSMAAPHVCGAATVYLGKNADAEPKQVEDYLVRTSHNGVIELNCSGQCGSDSPNKLLHQECPLQA